MRWFDGLDLSLNRHRRFTFNEHDDARQLVRRHLNCSRYSMSFVDVLGYAASAAVLATFCMSTMIALRIVALVSNVLFIAYGFVDHLYPVFMLHAILFPVNALSLVQFQRMAQSPLRNVLDGRAPIFLTGKMTVHKAALVLSDHNIGASCVVAGDRLIGIFSERDILRKVVAAGRDPGAMRVAEVMTPDPRTVSPETSLVDALSLMTDGHFRHLPVVDGDGHVIAMLSLRDIPSEHQITYHQLKAAQARRGPMATTLIKSSFRRLVARS
jgi:CBS domain-containing protein